MLAVLGDLVRSLEDLSSSPWFYLVVLVIAYLDSMIPLVPSETMVILGGVAAGRGELWLLAIIGFAVLGAFLLGILETFGAAYLGGEWQDVFAFGVLILVLVFRPTGLLGERVAG